MADCTFILGVDNVLEFTLVLSNGTLVTTNAHQYTDLFWALRGGGGGTYGVVLSATYQTHSKFPLVAPYLQVNFSSPEVAQSLVTELFRLHVNLSDAGWGGYTFINPQSMMAIFVAPNVTVEGVNRTLGPLVSFASNATGGAVLYVAPAYESFIDWWRVGFGSGAPGQVGSNTELASRLLPRTLAKDHPEEVARISLSLDGGMATKYVAPENTLKNNTNSLKFGCWRSCVSG